MNQHRLLLQRAEDGRPIRVGLIGAGGTISHAGTTEVVSSGEGGAEGETVGWADVDYDETDQAVRVRRDMEVAFARPDAGNRAAE
ncbi:MAG: hypothetical protein RIM84_24370 [Alphaproteobacteria bacterium]